MQQKHNTLEVLNVLAPAEITPVAGVSFVVRARNEQQHLRACIESLQSLMIPHEIIINLHLCTDGSRAIVEECATRQPIFIYEETEPVARAGYETLATPATHPHSMASLTNRCFARARYNWLFKWDADFVASPALLNFLQTQLALDERKPIRYKIPCHVGDKVNVENYLFNCLKRYEKHVFWEVPRFTEGTKRIHLTDVPIYTLPYTVLKAYWTEPRVLDADSEERYQRLVAMFGPEPVGAARAKCPDLNRIYRKLKRRPFQLDRWGIYLYA